VKQQNIDDIIKHKTNKYSSSNSRQVKLTESIIKDLTIERAIPLSLLEQKLLKHNCTVKMNTNANASNLYSNPILLMSSVLDGRFKFHWINGFILLPDLTKPNIISTSKQ